MSNSVTCVKCGEQAAMFVKQLRSDGGYHVLCICQMCGANATGKPFVDARAFGLILDDLPIFVSDDLELLPCDVHGCARLGAQRHHLAPRNKFNGSCEDWPTMNVCHYHHVEWHWRVEGLNLDGSIVSEIISQDANHAT